MDEKAQDELIATIQDESERLNRFINNLLDMTRLESGAIAVRAEATDLADVIGSALRRASKVLGSHHVKVDMTPDLPMPKLDAVLLEQVIFNLLDNAAKYAPVQSKCAMKARVSRLVISNASSINFIASTQPTAASPARASASPSAAGSSKRWVVRSRRAIAQTVPVPSSR
jgi:K+-sensing histidine kinase KdpD